MNSANFVKFVCESKIKPEYVWQMQFSLWVLEAEKYVLAQYDPRMQVSNLHVIEVARDEDKIKTIEESSALFIEDMDKMLDKLGVKFGQQWKQTSVREAVA